METYPKEHKAIRIAKKVAIAIGLTLLLALIGVFPGPGFHVYTIKQVAFVPHSDLGYADATVNCDILYNPILYPFYWVTPNVTGRLTGVFVVTYYPESYGGEGHGGPHWGYKPEERFDGYITILTSWGFWPNLLILAFVPFILEAARARILYLALFSGTLGFYTAVLPGLAIGLVAGMFIVWFLRFRLPKDNMLARFWFSLWE